MDRYTAVMAERLNTESLRYAQTVAETGSFTAAARAYGVAQPALSNGIAKLEDALGEPLFHRSARGVTPTPLGHHILPLIEQALHCLDTIQAETRGWIAPSAQAIRIGSSPLINPRLIAEAYRARDRTRTS